MDWYIYIGHIEAAEFHDDWYYKHRYATDEACDSVVDSIHLSDHDTHKFNQEYNDYIYNFKYYDALNLDRYLNLTDTDYTMSMSIFDGLWR